MDPGEPRLRARAARDRRISGSASRLLPTVALLAAPLLAGPVLGGCRPGPDRDTGDATLAVLAGHLLPPEADGGLWRLRPCGEEGALLLRDETAGALGEAWRWLEPPPDRPLFVELLVRLRAGEAGSTGTDAVADANTVADGTDAPSGDAAGPSAGQRASPAALAVRRAEHEGARCREVERLGGLAFLGRGNEPFWLIDVAPDGIQVREPERVRRYPPAEARAYPPAEPVSQPPADARLAPPAGARGQALADRAASAPEAAARALPDSVVYELPAEGDREALRATFVPARCADSMSGAWHAWRAEVRIGGQSLSGCAAEGGRSPVPLEPRRGSAEGPDAPAPAEAP